MPEISPAVQNAASKSSRIWISLALLIILAVFGAGWYKYIYAKDFWLSGQVACDEKGENCSTIKIKANVAPICNEWSGNCPELSCDGLSSSQCTIEKN